MRIVNRYADPHCLEATPTWAQSGTVKTVADGEHWRYVFPVQSSLIPGKLTGITLVMVEMKPAEAIDAFNIENSTTLWKSDGLMVADVSKETRGMIGIATQSELSATLTGMIYATMPEWPILQEVGARIFAADTAPY